MANLKANIRSSSLKSKIRSGGQGVKVTTAFVGANSLASSSLADLGDIEPVPPNVEEGSFLEYDVQEQVFKVNNVVDSGIF